MARGYHVDIRCVLRCFDIRSEEERLMAVLDLLADLFGPARFGNVVDLWAVFSPSNSGHVIRDSNRLH